MPSSGFCRISSDYKRIVEVWAVGCNGTVWKYHFDGSWTITPASDIVDVAAHGSRIELTSLASLNGEIWYTKNAVNFYRTGATGFASLANWVNAIGLPETWAVGYNGTLWRYNPDID